MRQVQEPDRRVKALLGCKDKGPSEAELAHAWEAQQRQIKLTMRTKQKELEANAAKAEETTDPFEKQADASGPMPRAAVAATLTPFRRARSSC